MQRDETTTMLDAANIAAVRLMLGKLSDPDLIEVYEAACGQGPIAALTADEMQKRGLNY